MSIIGAFVVALLIALLFSPGYRKGSFTPLVIMFFILFLAGIASQYWIVPLGPSWQGIYFLPLLFITLLVSLLLAAPSPYNRRSVKMDKETKEIATAVAETISIFIWLLFFMLILAVVFGWFKKPIV